MASCARCRRPEGFLSGVSINRQTARCTQCDQVVLAALNRFRERFLAYCSDGVITSEEWSQLKAGAAADGIDWHGALMYVQGDAYQFLERSLAFAFADGMITREEATRIAHLSHAFELPPHLAHPITQRIHHFRRVTRVRQGELETIAPSHGTHVDSDEVAHYETGARYHKAMKRGIERVEGRILLTSKRFLFLSPRGGSELTWPSVMHVDRQPGGVYVETSKRAGNGLYEVHDPVLTEAVIEAIARTHKRQLVREEAPSRHIPHGVRVAVWGKYQGKCSQCSAQEYLEFDHIIPFSKGGASSEGNVQLLCRRCNQHKSDRI